MISNPVVVPLRPLSGATVLWRAQGRLRVTVVVKATFGLVPGGQARLVAPAPLTPAELAPLVPSAGVLLHQPTAHAPNAAPVASMIARMRVTGERTVVDKRVYVYGDRSSPAAAPTPFASMPITWERAFGGPSVADNPVGVGAAPGDPQPNVLHPHDARRPVGFAAIPPSWPARAAHLGGLDADRLDEPIPSLPEAFDYRYFQSAPADQCAEHWRGDEWIELEGMHPTLPHLATRLPSAIAEARWGSASLGPPRAVDLVCDLLVVDPAQQVGSMIWRGHFMLEDEDRLDEIEVSAGVAMPGYPPIPWPGAGHAGAAADDGSLGAAFGTVIAKSPFANVVDETTTVAPALRPSAPGRAVPETLAGDSTSSSVMSPFASGVLPFAPAPAPPTNAPGRRKPPGFETAGPQLAPFRKPVAPFELAPPRASTLPAAAPIPGAPWSAEPAPTAPAASDDEPETLLIETRSPFVDAAAPIAPPPIPPLPPPPPSIAMSVAPGPVSERARVATNAGADDALRAQFLERVAAGERAGDLALAGADLSGLDLTGANLSGANLRGARLAGANLSRARLDDAHLDAADLSGAVLSGADLARCDLTRATLERARLDGARLDDAVFGGARGAGAQFAGAKGARANLSRGTWDEASFRGADLPGVDFSGASLRDAGFGEANLVEARLDDARAAGASFAGARAARARAHGAELEGAILDGLEAPGSQWDGAVLARCSLRDAKLAVASFARATAGNASFAGADLENANLQRLVAPNVDFTNAKLDGADLRQARAPEAIFDGARLRRATAAKAELPGARFTGANLDGVNLREANLHGAVFTRVSITGADLRDADLGQADLRDVDSSSVKLAGANLAGARRRGGEKA